MPKYASFDHTKPEPQQVNGWYDTDSLKYPSLPDFRDLLVLTQEQWDARGLDVTSWAVQGGTLIPYTPPMPLPQQAQILLGQKLAQGIQVTSDSLPLINATYALDPTSTAQIFQIGTFANSFQEFPSGSDTQLYPDITGQPHIFTVPVFIAFLRAVAALVSNMQLQAGVMANGGTPAWPQQIAALS